MMALTELTTDQLIRNCERLREERDRARWQRHGPLYALQELQDDPGADGGTRALALDATVEGRKAVCAEDRFVAAFLDAVTGGEAAPALWRLTWVDVRAGYHAHDDPGALAEAVRQVQLLRDGLAPPPALRPAGPTPAGVPAAADDDVPL